MTRVMQVMAGAAQGGAEAFFDRLVPALSRAGVTQSAVIRRNAARAARLRDSGVPTTELAFGGLLDIFTGPALRRAVQAFAPDLQLAWMSRAARFCRPNGHIVVGRLGGYYDLKYYRYCHHLIGNTQDIRDYIVRSGWPAENAWYLPNFVDGGPMPAVARTSLNTPEDAPLLLAMGRLHANKGFDVLIPALEEIPRAVLWLAGAGPEEAVLRSLAEARGVSDRVRFLGWRQDMPALMAAADVLVCASRHEPLGNVILEAWAHRVPVVAAASAGPAALIDDAQNGLLVPVEDARALALAVNTLLSDAALASTLVEAGYQAYSSTYSEDRVVAQYREFFEQVCP